MPPIAGNVTLPGKTVSRGIILTVWGLRPISPQKLSVNIILEIYA